MQMSKKRTVKSLFSKGRLNIRSTRKKFSVKLSKKRPKTRLDLSTRNSTSWSKISLIMLTKKAKNMSFNFKEILI